MHRAEDSAAWVVARRQEAAARAGMTVEEYTKFLVENKRAVKFESFNYQNGAYPQCDGPSS